MIVYNTGSISRRATTGANSGATAGATTGANSGGKLSFGIGGLIVGIDLE